MYLLTNTSFYICMCIFFHACILSFMLQMTYFGVLCNELAQLATESLVITLASAMHAWTSSL